MSTNSVRVALEVNAGLVPGQPIKDHTMQFFITSDIWYAQGAYEGKEKEAQLEILKVYGLAQEYARNLMNPKMVNWVRLDWVYF